MTNKITITKFSDMKVKRQSKEVNGIVSIKISQSKKTNRYTLYQYKNKQLYVVYRNSHPLTKFYSTRWQMN